MFLTFIYTVAEEQGRVEKFANITCALPGDFRESYID